MVDAEFLAQLVKDLRIENPAPEWTIIGLHCVMRELGHSVTYQEFRRDTVPYLVESGTAVILPPEPWNGRYAPPLCAG